MKSDENQQIEKTDSVKDKSQTIDKDELEKKLQSPVENHFALTPVANSESSSPANGFTSQECTDLLREELDHLVVHEEGREVKEIVGLELNLKSSASVEGLVSPSEENISMFTIDQEKRDAEEKEKSTKLEVKKFESKPEAEVRNFFWRL